MNSSIILFKDANVVLISGSSSSGKSTMAKLICDIDSSFIKINTKKININSEEEYSRKYFQDEIRASSELICKKLDKISDIFLESKIGKGLKLREIAKLLSRKLQNIAPQLYLEILYKNYFKEADKILSEGQRCIIDHNIFLDPYDLRKDIFFRHFSGLGERLKTISLYVSLEKVILNNLERNQRFYGFLNSRFPTDDNKKIIEIHDKKMGFSHIVFRRPLRVIENFLSLYKVNNNNEGCLQKLEIDDFNKIIEIALWEQEKLIGFLIYKNYPFSHIQDEELINFRADFNFIKELKCNEVCIYNHRISSALKILVDRNIRKKDVITISTFPKNLVDLRKPDSSENLKAQIRNTWSRIYKEKSYILNISPFRNIWDKRIFIIHEFSTIRGGPFLKDILNEVVNHKKNCRVIYPIGENVHSDIVIVNKEVGYLDIKCNLKDVTSKNFAKFNNNLVFLANLFAQAKSINENTHLKFRMKHIATLHPK